MPKIGSNPLEPVRPLVYQRGTPPKGGVYACRIPDPHDRGELFCKDVFLDWYDGKWYYVGSDQKCRSEVIGWIGPLPRVSKATINDQEQPSLRRHRGA